MSSESSRSNWANETLSAKQLRYAATDAWVSREMYLSLVAAGAEIREDKETEPDD